MRRIGGFRSSRRQSDVLIAVVVTAVVMLTLFSLIYFQSVTHTTSNALRGSHHDHSHSKSRNDMPKLPKLKSIWHKAQPFPRLVSHIPLDPRDPVEDLDNSVVLVVNVASYCGYTDMNYKWLQKIYHELHDEMHLPFRILAFPCNQFGEQEQGAPEAIAQFVTTKYNVTFDMMAKVVVNGLWQHRFFSKLKEYAGIREIGWNFEKFVISKGGIVRKYFDVNRPLDDVLREIRSAIDEPRPSLAALPGE